VKFRFSGKPVVKGNLEGRTLVSKYPLSFLGGVDPNSGRVIDPDSDIKGESITGKILIYPTGKGSTVGSYVIYAMKKMGTAPLAIVLREADTVTIIGCVLADIPLMHRVKPDPLSIGNNVRVMLSGDALEVLE